jgi:hypothetical protein
MYDHTSRSRSIKPSQQIKKSGFPGTRSPKQRNDVTGGHAERYPVNCPDHRVSHAIMSAKVLDSNDPWSVRPRDTRLYGHGRLATLSPLINCIALSASGAVMLGSRSLSREGRAAVSGRLRPALSGSCFDAGIPCWASPRAGGQKKRKRSACARVEGIRAVSSGSIHL